MLEVRINVTLVFGGFDAMTLNTYILSARARCSVDVIRRLQNALHAPAAKVISGQNISVIHTLHIAKLRFA